MAPIITKEKKEKKKTKNVVQKIVKAYIVNYTFDLRLTNAGEVRKVAKIDDEGNILQEYASVMEASKLNNIE